MKWTILLALLCSAIITKAQDPHFHQTNGFGTDSDYGLGGSVYKVTNLNSEGAGSLRYLLEDVSGNRLIVFEVGGIIDLGEDDITINNGNVTIAGQTAPNPGITLIKGGLKVRADNVLVQHLTIRVGDGDYTDPVGWESDGYNVTTSNVVFDHCSVSWAIDENMSVSRGGNNVTFYRCIVAEGLSNGIHWKGEHSCGSLVMDNSKNISIIGSYYAHNFRRHPRLKDGTEVVYANNVVYNYGIYAAHIGGEQGEGYSSNPGIGNFIGNAFFKGADGWDNYFVEGHKGDFDKDMNAGNGKAYLEDNIMLDRLTGDKMLSHDEHITILSTSNNLPSGFVANQAYANVEKVLRNVGSRPNERSDVDARLVQDLIDGTGSIIDSQSEVGGYPTYESTSRELGTIPQSFTDRRIWLDSISSSLAVNTDVNLDPLYTFIDNNYTVGKAEVSALNFGLKAYPNPANAYVNVAFSLNSESVVNIKLVNTLGQVTNLIENKQIVFNDNLLSVDLSGYQLKKGIYLLVLEVNGNTESITLMVE